MHCCTRPAPLPYCISTKSQGSCLATKLSHSISNKRHDALRRAVLCYNPESAGSQAPGPDVRACRRQSDIPCQGGQYVLTVVSRHCIACETLTVRKSSYNQASISHICSSLVPQSQAITTTSQSPETHLKGIRPHVMHYHTYATWHPHADPPCMRALAPSYDTLQINMQASPFHMLLLLSIPP